MTAFKGLGTYGNAVGVVTPLDHKLAQAGLLCKTTTPLQIRTGLFYSGVANIVSGTAGMAYSVGAYDCASQRSASAGVVLGGNDGSISVATTAAPGANSRYDVVYHWQREYSLDGVNSDPVIGVVQGTASATPAVPSLAAFPGAIPLATILVPAGVTATNAGTTFTQTAPFTSVDGGRVVFRTTTERDLWTTALPDQRALVLADGLVYRWNGTGWKGTDSGLVPITPSSVVNGTIGPNGQVTYSGVGSVSVNGVFTSAYENYVILPDITRSVNNGDSNIRWRAAGTDDATANYLTPRNILNASTNTPVSVASTLLPIDAGATAASRSRGRIEVFGPQLNAHTAVLVSTTNSGGYFFTAGGNHSVNAQYDGFSVIAAAGVISGSFRVYGYNNL